MRYINRLFTYLLTFSFPYFVVPTFPVSLFHRLQSVPAFASPAFSTLAVWCRVFQSRVFRSRIFSAPSFINLVKLTVHLSVAFVLLSLLFVVAAVWRIKMYIYV